MPIHKYKNILSECKNLLSKEDLKSTIQKLERTLNRQISDYNSGIRNRRGHRSKSAHSVLEDHKLKVQRGRFRYKPIREVCELNKIQEQNAGSFTQADYSYMYKRRQKALQNAHNPTPFFRVCGERAGGYITPEEKTWIRMWEVVDKINIILARSYYAG